MPRQISKDHFSIYSLKAVFTDPEKLLPYMSALQYSAGEIMICNFYEEQKLYLFTEGRFNMYVFQDNGNRLFIRTCESVILAGDFEFTLHNWPDLRAPVQNDFYYEMLTDCTMIVINYKAIRNILLSDSRFLNFVCRTLVEKFIYFADSEITTNLTNAEARVAGYLLQSADSEGAWKENQKTAAEHLRISYRHLHRVLKSFVETGCIARISGGYRIEEAEKLKEYLC